MRRIRSQAGGRSVAIVALTSWGQNDDRQRSREAGFDGHMKTAPSHSFWIRWDSRRPLAENDNPSDGIPRGRLSSFRSARTKVGMRKATLLHFLLMTTTATWPQTQPSSITFFTDTELRRAIQSAPEEVAGQPGLYSLRLSPPSESPVIGIRRTTPGKSELHANFTDVWYVIDGAATLLTGGTVEDGTETAPGETRGRGIKDGNSRQIHKGDYAVIPAGTPHWISKVEGKDFLYIVVKVPVQEPPVQ